MAVSPVRGPRTGPEVAATAEFTRNTAISMVGTDELGCHRRSGLSNRAERPTWSCCDAPGRPCCPSVAVGFGSVGGGEWRPALARRGRGGCAHAVFGPKVGVAASRHRGRMQVALDPGERLVRRPIAEAKKSAQSRRGHLRLAHSACAPGFPRSRTALRAFAHRLPPKAALAPRMALAQRVHPSPARQTQRLGDAR
jgi:hypothetical protein